MLPAQPNQSLIDGLSVLQALAVADEPVGSREMARRIGLEPTRVNRLLKTLEHLGVARQTPDRRYVPGPAMHVLSVQALRGSGLIRTAVPVLESLLPLGHSVAMGVLWREHVCYLYHARTGTPVAEALGHMRLYPAGESGIGVALLAAAGKGLPAGLKLANHRDLLTRIADAKKRGYAYVRRSSSPLDASLGVAVGEKPYAAIALAGAIKATEAKSLAACLREAAGRIEQSQVSKRV